MNSKLFIVISVCLGIAACGGGGSSSSTPPPPGPTPTPATPTPVPTSGNYVRIQISSGSSSICDNINLACVTVQVCQPGTSTCDTINNVLVDTGSFGLRVFGSLLPNTNSSLTPMTSGGLPVAECVSYADNTSNWGPVKYANVMLNGTGTAESIPIQVLDATFPGMQDNCSGAVATPTQFGLNGIIGVGPFIDDNGVSNYLACNGTNCTGVVPPAYVSNPITKFGPGNNNGLTLTFGNVALSGVYGADGYGIFGVGSNSSNTPPPGSSPGIFKIESGSLLPMNVFSQFNSTIYYSFMDTGSNMLFFSNAFLPGCSSGNGLFCPPGNVSESALMAGTNGSGGVSTATINFVIGNADSLISSGNNAFSNIGGIFPGINGIIDWGLPFYLGRTVYMVFAGESAVIDGVTLPPSPNGYWIY